MDLPENEMSKILEDELNDYQDIMSGALAST